MIIVYSKNNRIITQTLNKKFIYDEMILINIRDNMRKQLFIHNSFNKQFLIILEFGMIIYYQFFEC